MSSAPSPEHPRHLHAEAKRWAESLLAHAHLAWSGSWKQERLLFVCSIVQFGLFACLAWWVRKHPVDAPDVALTRILQKQRPGWVQAAIQSLSGIAGSATLFNVLTLPVVLLFWLQRLRLEAVMTAITSWGMLLVRVLVQRLVHRPRPSSLLVHVSHHKQSKSFPSGHVTSSLTFWGWLLAVGLNRWSGSQTRKKALLSIPALLVAFVGISRVYLGEHWATDVLGGYLLGGGWVSLCLQVYLRLRKDRVLMQQRRG